jgi:hypothetical protein
MFMLYVSGAFCNGQAAQAEFVLFAAGSRASWERGRDLLFTW